MRTDSLEGECTQHADIASGDVNVGMPKKSIPEDVDSTRPSSKAHPKAVDERMQTGLRRNRGLRVIPFFVLFFLDR